MTHTIGHGAKFGRKKEEAIIALLSQRSFEDAARVVGISTKTLMRWLKLPEFEAAYQEARRATSAQSVARLQQASSAAVSTLLRIMVDLNAPAATRARAAAIVISLALRAVELEDLAVRVAKLERAAERKKGA